MNDNSKKLYNFIIQIIMKYGNESEEILAFELLYRCFYKMYSFLYEFEKIKRELNFDEIIDKIYYYIDIELENLKNLTEFNFMNITDKCLNTYEMSYLL